MRQVSGQAHGESESQADTRLPLGARVQEVSGQPDGTQAGRAQNRAAPDDWSLGPAQGHDSTASCRGVRVVDEKTSVMKLKGPVICRNHFHVISPLRCCVCDRHSTHLSLSPNTHLSLSPKLLSDHPAATLHRVVW